MTAHPDSTTSEFSGRVALVTGGSRGIGRACCVRLARAGARVAINYRSGREQAEETARLVTAAGGQPLLVAADVSVEADVARLVAEIQAHWGPVELLVNNAGVFDYLPHEQTTLEVWRRTLDINLTGAFLVTWAVKDEMLERGYGRIVNMSSISALDPRPMSIAYAASKAGLTGFTKSIAAAFASRHVRVNAVAPGLIETEILDGVDPAALERIIGATPLQRIGTAEEVAAMVYFLLSDESSYTTGQTLVCSGGRVMRP